MQLIEVEMHQSIGQRSELADFPCESTLVCSAGQIKSDKGKECFDAKK